MKIPTLEQLQAWTAQWDQAKRYLSYQKVFDQRLQQANDTEEISQVVDDLVNQITQGELGQDPTEVEQVVDDLVNRVEAKDQQTKNAIKAQVCEVIAGQYIATLNDELGNALENLGLEPPWSARNNTSGLYRTDNQVIPLSIRMLDGLRQSELSGYEDFSEPLYRYGCTSPISHILMEKNEGPEDEITNSRYNKKLDEKLANYVDELAKRLTNFRANINEKWTGHLPDTATLKSSVLKELEALVDNQNAKSLVDIETAVKQKTTELIDHFVHQDLRRFLQFSQGEVNLDTYRFEIEEVFKQFNLEKNAERLLKVCYDVAFSGTEYKAVEHLETLKDKGEIRIPGVLRAMSTNSARVLFSVNDRDAKSAQRLAEMAVSEQSYGALRAALNAIEAKGEQIDKALWSYMAKRALEGNDPSIIRQCLQIKKEDRRLWLEDANQTDPALMHGLLMASIVTDGRGKMRSNEGRLQILLDAGVDVNVNITNPLMEASRNGCESAINQLIEAGADVNAIDRDSGTALKQAVFHGYEGIVEKLIAAGANVNSKNMRGETALMIACERGKAIVVKHLLGASEIDIEARYKDGRTALMYACLGAFQMYPSLGEHRAIIEELIAAGANVNATDKKGHSAIDYAHQHRPDSEKEAIVCMLEEVVAKVDSALMAAYDSADTSAVRELLQINDTDKNDRTALMLACEYGSTNIVGGMINKGADIHTVAKNGDTALIIACELGRDPVIEELLRYMRIAAGDESMHEHYYYDAELMSACKKGHEPTVSLLLKKGAHADARDKAGNTALITACQRNNLTIGERLIDANATINATGKDGETALMHVCRIREPETETADKVLEKLIEKGAKIEAKDKDGKTALITACQQNNLPIAEKLIEKGANINAKSNDGETALMLAIVHGEEPLVDNLIQAGVDIDATNSRGETALMMACQRTNEKMVSALIQAGADINKRDHSGRILGKTALDYAKKTGNKSITNLLNVKRRRRPNRLPTMQPASTKASTASMTQSSYVGRIARFLVQCSEAATRCVSARGPRR